jgi:hypothetical protein
LKGKLKIIESLSKPTGFSMLAGKRAALSKIGERLKNSLFQLKDKE